MKWALITGGALRLGAAVTKKLAEGGYGCWIHYRQSREAAEELAEEIRSQGGQAEPLGADLVNEAGLKGLIDRVSTRPLSLVVHNVGPYPLGSALETPLITWRQLYELEFFVPLQLIQQLLPHVEREGGSFIMIGSAGLNGTRPDPHAPAYRLAKQTLLHLTRTLAPELALHGVRINMVSPGQLPDSEDLTPRSRRPPFTLPMGRPATYEEVTNALLYLIQEGSAYVTGQNIEVSGGYAL